MASGGPMRCPLCLKPFEQPKLLQKCMHSFCKSCLCKYVEPSLPKSESNNAIYCCPICKIEFEGPTSSKSLSKWLDRLPSDDVVTGLIATRTQYCEPCYIRKRQSPASKVCKECCETLCAECAAKHRSFKNSRSHTLTGADDTNTLTLDHGLESYSTCDRHKEQALEYYCNTHEDVVCAKCVIAKHKGCNILGVDDVSDQLSRKIPVESILSDIENLKRDILSIDSSFEKENNRFEEEILSAIEDKRKAINESFDRYKEEVIQDMKKSTIQQSIKISQLRQENQTLLTAVENSEVVINNVMKYGSSMQTYFCCQAMDRQLKRSKQCIEQGKCYRSPIAFKQNFSLSVVALADGIDSIGKFIINIHKPCEYAQTQKAEKNNTISVNVINTQQKTLTQSETIKAPVTLKTNIKPNKNEVSSNSLEVKVSTPLKNNVEVKTMNRYTLDTPNVSSPNFRGATFLADDRVILSDIKFSRIILFDSNFSYVSQLTFKVLPGKVAAVGKHEIAVGLQSAKRVDIVTVCSETMTVIRSIHLLDCPVSMYCNKDILFASTIADADFKLVSINPTNGETKNVHGIQEFHGRMHFAVFNRETEAYLLSSFRKKYTLYCQTLDGKKIFDVHINQNSGIDVDKYGNIFVASFDKILLLTPDGKHIKTFETGSLKTLCEVRINCCGDKLLVTQNETSEIRVLHLSYS